VVEAELGSLQGKNSPMIVKSSVARMPCALRPRGKSIVERHMTRRGFVERRLQLILFEKHGHLRKKNQRTT